MSKKTDGRRAMKVHRWQAISRGDQVDIIAPGMSFDREELARSLKVLEIWGLQVHCPKNLIGRHHVSAQTEAVRFAHLQQALASSSSVIWAARGGYGSLHLLKYLKKMKPPKKPKVLIGFSDITTLHEYINGEWNWTSLHGPHADRLHTLSPMRLRELHGVLFGRQKEIIFKNIKPLNDHAKKSKSIQGPIVGGNLITTQSTIGTSWQLNVKNKILFLEEIGERGYRVDRVFEHMKLASFLKGVKAIVFGPFVGGDEPSGKNHVMNTIKAFAQSADVPVFSGLLSGHIPQSRTLPLNTLSRIYSCDGTFYIAVDAGSST